MSFIDCEKNGYPGVVSEDGLSMTSKDGRADTFHKFDDSGVHNLSINVPNGYGVDICILCFKDFADKTKGCFGMIYFCTTFYADDNRVGTMSHVDQDQKMIDVIDG